MKQLLITLLAILTFTACSSDDDPVVGQDYTSFVVIHNEDVTLNNAVAGYLSDGKYIKVGDLGDLSKGKYSPEIRVQNNSITEIYLFSDYMNTTRLDAVYKLEKNKKNIITIASGTGGISVSDKSDPKQYPQ